MAKKGLFSKVFGKQESGCCSMSFEEVSEEGGVNEHHNASQKPDSAEKEAAKADASRDTASNR